MTGFEACTVTPSGQRFRPEAICSATVPRPPMQTSARRRPASRPPGTVAPMSISRSPAPPVVTEQRSALASAAMLSTSFAARAETLGAGPLYFCIVVSLPVWRLCIQHLRQFVQASAAAVEGGFRRSRLRRKQWRSGGSGGCGCRGRAGRRSTRARRRCRRSRHPGRHRGSAAARAPCGAGSCGVRPAQAARWAVEQRAVVVVEHVERGAGARVDLQQVRACRPLAGSRTRRGRRRSSAAQTRSTAAAQWQRRRSGASFTGPTAPP